MQSTIIRSISFPVITFTLSVKSELYLQLRFDVKIKSFKTIVILHFHQQLGYKRVVRRLNWSGILWANSFLRPHNFTPLISSYSTFPLIILHFSAKNKRGRKTVFTTDQIPPAQGGFGQSLRFCGLASRLCFYKQRFSFSNFILSGTERETKLKKHASGTGKMQQQSALWWMRREIQIKYKR